MCELCRGLRSPADEDFFIHSIAFSLTVDLSSELFFLLGAEKSNSPGAQGVIKVLLHAFLASPKRKSKAPWKVRQNICSASGGRDSFFISLFSLQDIAAKFSGPCFKPGCASCFWNAKLVLKNDLYLFNYYFIRQPFAEWRAQALIAAEQTFISGFLSVNAIKDCSQLSWRWNFLAGRTGQCWWADGTGPEHRGDTSHL